MREQRGETEAALRVWREAVRLLPGEIEPRVALAAAYERAGRRREAFAEVLAIQSLEPQRPGLEEWLRRLKAGEGR
jgi:Flp pilus assembly protein TadD